ncbi:hypothetical protein [Saccharothrix sp. ALI-22-I]|uniref:hypothetical protein n=1 Tax=Saccharothrix sp. ALI-22-I TaxID=1933778 RepID=UPI00117ADD8B|nr:hypothetical protein [Saccharothrix sp. ALI-22-I]
MHDCTPTNPDRLRQSRLAQLKTKNGRPEIPSSRELREDWRDANDVSTHIRCPHGTRYGYQRFHCRGKCCRVANTAYQNGYRPEHTRVKRTLHARRR